MPESYYLTNQTSTKKENMSRLTVGRGSVHEHKIHVQISGSVIRFVNKESNSEQL